MNYEFLKGSKNPLNFFKIVKYRTDFRKVHPLYFDPSGLLVFCAEQGSGKTLSAVQYCTKVNNAYFSCVFCSNVSICGFEFNCYYKYRVISDTLSEVCYYKISDNSLVRKVTMFSKGGITKFDITIYQDIKIVIEYDGLDCIKYLSNGEYGVL